LTFNYYGVVKLGVGLTHPKKSVVVAALVDPCIIEILKEGVLYINGAPIIPR